MLQSIASSPTSTCGWLGGSGLLRNEEERTLEIKGQAGVFHAVSPNGANMLYSSKRLNLFSRKGGVHGTWPANRPELNGSTRTRGAMRRNVAGNEFGWIWLA